MAAALAVTWPRPPCPAPLPRPPRAGIAYAAMRSACRVSSVMPAPGNCRAGKNRLGTQVGAGLRVVGTGLRAPEGHPQRHPDEGEQEGNGQRNVGTWTANPRRRT